MLYIHLDYLDHDLYFLIPFFHELLHDRKVDRGLIDYIPMKVFRSEKDRTNMERRHKMITIRLFSNLRKRHGKDEIVIHKEEISTKELIESIDHRMMESVKKGQILVAVNHEFADLNKIVREGDEVAIFPPLSGG